MRCLVTGGAGFIGSNLTQALVARGEEVRVFDNLETGLRSNLDEVADRIELVEADVRDLEALKLAMKDVEVVFHQAALGSVPRSVEDPVTSFEINARGTLHVLMAAQQAGVRRVVYAASSSAYGDTEVLPKHEEMPQRPQSPYAADKLHGESLCRAFSKSYGLGCVALRYFNVFGPRQRPDSAYAAVIPKFIDAVRSGTPPTIHGDGGQTRDFTFVQNVVGANLLAAEAGEKAVGRVMNVGNGARTSLLQLLEIIQEVLGTSVEPSFTEVRAGDVRDSQADISLAKELIGYEPTVDLLEGLRHTVAWFGERS